MMVTSLVNSEFRDTMSGSLLPIQMAHLPQPTDSCPSRTSRREKIVTAPTTSSVLTRSHWSASDCAHQTIRESSIRFVQLMLCSQSNCRKVHVGTAITG